MMDRAIKDMGLKGKSIPVKRGKEIDQLDALVLPGGESTTISKLMTWSDVYEAIQERVKNDDLPVLGTCAGCILLAKYGDKEVKRTKTRLLGLMDMEVSRNSYGRQVDSFEAEIDFKPLRSKKRFPVVFIRAPSITKVFNKCEVLAKYGGEIIAAREGRRMALTFHPELTEDTRIHRYFLKSVLE
jgi:5'-phosphate synthase pdxT subunit